MIIFGSGFAAIYVVFGAMYWHAYRMRDVLGLSTFEITFTRTTMVSQFLNVAVALLSILVACALRTDHASFAGYVYFLVPAVMLWRRHRRCLEERTAPLPVTVAE